MKYEKLSGFSDEIAEDVVTQFEALKKLNIHYFEPRGINGKNIADLNDEEVESLRSVMNTYGIKASSIGSPIGKIDLADDFEKHFLKFTRVVEIAEALDTRYIRMFSFYHASNESGEWSHAERKEVLERLKRMIDYARGRNIILLHENEKGIYGDTIERCADLMNELGCDNFKAVFDPANFVQSGQNTAEAYDRLKEFIAYVHIKDALLKDGSVVPAGEGDGNVEYVLKSLFESGYEGFLSIEPHLGNFAGLKELERSDKMAGLPEGGEGTFTLAYRALETIVDKTVKKLKLGIVGFGNMGTGHAKNVAEGKVLYMELGAVCDISAARREAARQQYPDIPIFDSAEELYRSGTCDAVIIATPHYEHPSLVIKAFEYGLHVITEKPAGVYTRQVKEMNAAAARSDRKFGIMYNQRTNPVYMKLREMVQSGELGHIKRITWIITDWYRPQAYHDSSTWRSTWKTEGGGALINQNPHQIDIWQWIFGMPDRIFARAGFGKYYDIEVEDEVMAYFEYDNGTTGEYITSTGEAPGTNRLEIACDMGKVVVENNHITFYRNVISEREFNKANKAPFGRPECMECNILTDSSGGEQHVGILRNFASAVLRGTELLAKGEDGIPGLTISNAIHLSAWTGESVDVKNFPDDRFYELLQERIRNSKVVKKESQVVADTENTY